MSSSDTFVIVGAGMAGGKAAETLREEGFDGRIVLVGAEPHRPYERPPLSKDFLRGESEQPAWLQDDEGWYAANDVELRPRASSQSIDAGGKAVVLAGGERLDYDRLLLATGGRAAAPARARRRPRRRAPPAHDRGLERIRAALRRRRPARRDRRRLDRLRGRRVRAPEGHGRHAARVARAAASARPRPRARRLLPRRAPGPRRRPAHSAPASRRSRATAARSASGSPTAATIDCAAVLVGIGVAPRTSSSRPPAGVDNGVVVDDRLQYERRRHLRRGRHRQRRHPLFGRHVRVEHWANALEQGPAAARSMLGQDVSYDKVPYFFSDQYDVGMEYAGLRPGRTSSCSAAT